MLAKNMTEWHRLVCERDKYICQVCEKDFSFDCYFLEDGRNAYVCGDHIQSRGSRIDLQFNVDNGRCVCLSCHNKRHSKGLNRENL
jgi:hypothetical protein